MGIGGNSRRKGASAMKRAGGILGAFRKAAEAGAHGLPLCPSRA